MTEKSTVPKFSLAQNNVPAKCVKVYDGDTAQFVFAPFEGGKSFRFSCRMKNYNSAELRTHDAEEKQIAIRARDALIEMILGKQVSLNIYDFDKYGRPLVDVYVDGVYINDKMISTGHGKKYDGRGKKEY